MKHFLFLLLSILSGTGLAQQDSLPPPVLQDTLPPPVNRPLAGQRSQETKQIGIEDYKIISYNRDTTYLDTTLTLQKEYRYNYIRKDDFELMPFANVGQPYNKLGYQFGNRLLYPALGATAKHYNYLELRDIQYYSVATPMTELFFKTTFEQGQLLDALLTFNTSPRFNFSIAYKGFRSLGKYQFSQAESGNFRTTMNYSSKNGAYSLRAHIAAQDILTEDNGGLLDRELQFESEDPEFSDRSRIDVVFTNAESKILGKRYFLDHGLRIAGKATDSLRNTSLDIGHEFAYETRYYQFSQDSQDDYFGDVFLSPVDDKANLKTMYNEFNVVFYNNILGRLKAYSGLYHYNYFFNSLLLTDSQLIGNQLKGEEITVGAAYDKQIGGFALGGDMAYTVAGDLSDYKLDAFASYALNSENRLRARLYTSSRMPDFNFLLYQSDYENFNWQHSGDFEKEKVYSLELNLESSFAGNASASFTTLDNYSYFASTATEQQILDGQENAFVKPFQEANTIDYLRIRYNKEFRLGKWALNNTVMYQNVLQDSPVLNVPAWLTRNTLYFSSDVFKKAMYVQTGVTFKYFTSYYMNAYNPLLSEFYIQDREELGGFPMLDFFINARVRQTRIYLKAEHFNSSFTGNSFYAAPGYPYRDFVIRFGLVWNFFS